MFQLPEGLEAQEKPERLSKLAFYLLDKEPLIYLFIINSDFIPDPEGKVLGPFDAGVNFKDNRVLFFYKPNRFEEMPREELYFVVVHEAFHIFKKHTERHNDLKEHMLRNIAEDAVINYEIDNATFEGEFKPKSTENDIHVPDDFLRDFRSIREDAIETHRLYNWIKKKQEEQRNKQFGIGDFVKVKNEKDESKQYGQITDYYGGGGFKVKKMSQEEMMEKASAKKKGKGQEKDQNDSPTEHEEGEDLDKVYFSSDIKKGRIPKNEDQNQSGRDKHFDGNESEKEKEEQNVEKNLFADKILSQAEKMESELKITSAGTGKGNLTSKLRELNKPKVNWRKELGRKINVFKSNNSFLYEPTPSYVNYPWRASSRYGILGKYPMMQKRNLQTYMIFAIDTSGSVFHSSKELEKFFTEVDKASKELEFSGKGHVLTMQWDWDIAEGLKIYHPGDWKKFQVRGGGGTSPRVIFNYFNEVFKERGGKFHVKENEVRFSTEDKKKLPFLAILTDGYFYDRLDDDALGIYKNAKDNILYFTRDASSIYPKENFVKYE